MTASLAEWAQRRCRALPSGTPAMPEAQARTLLPIFAGWTIEAGSLIRTFTFADYHRTIAFVNAVAWIAEREDHHPELTVAYDRCRVAYSTHSVGGLSENDFICAARIEAL